MSQQGWKIATTTNDKDKAKELQRLGIASCKFDNCDNVTQLLSESEYLLISIPPTKLGDKVLAKYKSNIIDNDWRWIGYLSSMQVYEGSLSAINSHLSQHNNEDEYIEDNVPVTPNNALAKRVVDAENAWLNLYRHHKLPVHIIRLATVYGAGRNAISQLKKIQKCAANNIDNEIAVLGQFFPPATFIHTSDLAAAITKSMESPSAGEIYNICDDNSSSREDIFDYLTEYITTHMPNVAKNNLLMSNILHNKNESLQNFPEGYHYVNRKMKEKLAVNLQYGSYLEGVKSLTK